MLRTASEPPFIADHVYQQRVSLVGKPRYPHIVDAYKATFATVRALPCDLLLTPHPDASGWTPANADAPHPKPMTCGEYADGAKAKFDAQLAKQRE